MAKHKSSISNDKSLGDNQLHRLYRPPLRFSVDSLTTQEIAKLKTMLEINSEVGEDLLFEGHIEATTQAFNLPAGETVATLKTKYSHIRIVGNLARTESNIKPFSFNFDPVVHLLPSTITGFEIEIDDNHNAARMVLLTPSDADTSLSFQVFSALLSAGTGRTYVKAVGVKA